MIIYRVCLVKAYKMLTMTNRLLNYPLLRKRNASRHQMDLYRDLYRNSLSCHLENHKCRELRLVLETKSLFSSCTTIGFCILIALFI